MKHKNKILALCLGLLTGIVFVQTPSVSEAKSSNASPRSGQATLAEADSGEVSADSGVADSGSTDPDPDFYIPACEPGSDEKTELCDQFFEVADSSTYDDSSDFVSDAAVLSTFCDTWDFSQGKVTICHKQQATVTAANRGVCEGHLRNHPTDTVGPCLDESGDPITNEEEHSACIADSSSFYVTADEYAADSGLAAAVDNCADTIPVIENPNNPPGGVTPTGAKPGRFNWREIFQ